MRDAVQRTLERASKAMSVTTQTKSILHVSDIVSMYNAEVDALVRAVQRTAVSPLISHGLPVPEAVQVSSSDDSDTSFPGLWQVGEDIMYCPILNCHSIDT